MDVIGRQLLYCLRAYRMGEARAERVSELAGEHWSALYRLSGIHKMSPIVLETLWQEPDFCSSDPELSARWKRESLVQTAGQAVRTRKIAEISALFRENHIPHALVKGALCRALYSRPDLRPSGDEDLYIAPADRERSEALLRRAGLICFMAEEGDDVTHWNEQQSGLHIELHTRLLSLGTDSELAMNGLFEEQLAHTVTAPPPGERWRPCLPPGIFCFLYAMP